MLFHPSTNQAHPIDQVRDAVFDALADAGERVALDLQYRLDTDYPPASSPGESPHRRTGDLQASVQQRVETDADAVTLTVDTDSEYAPYLEYGTDRMAARPCWQPAFDDAEPRVTQRVADEIRKL